MTDKISFTLTDIIRETRDVECVRKFVEATSTPIHGDFCDELPFFCAINLELYDIIEYLIHQDPRVIDTRSNYETLPIFHAVRCGSLECVKILVEHGCNFAAKDIFSQNVLHESVRYDNMEMIEYFIRLYPNFLHDTDNFGYTPLHTAAMWSTHEIVKYLIEKGSDTSVVDKRGNMPLHNSIRMMNKKVVPFLSSL